MCASQLEGRQIMIKRGSGPGLGAMAGGTVLAQCSFMRVILLMAGKTSGGSALKDVGCVAFYTQHVHMRAGQLKDRQVVVKPAPGPGLGAMAGGTILAQCSIVRIVFLVAGKTVGSGTLENIVDVAGRTQHVCMRAGQLESRQIVVKRGPGPGLGAMAGCTVLAQCSIVRIVFLVAGKTVGSGTLEDIVDVASRAQHVCMRAGQLEGCQVMVKRGPGPGLGAMTGGTVLA